MPTKPVGAVAGIGPGNGAALARRFATDGYAVARRMIVLPFPPSLVA